MTKKVGKWAKWWKNGQNGGKMAKMVEKWPKWWKNGQNGGKMAEVFDFGFFILDHFSFWVIFDSGSFFILGHF